MAGPESADSLVYSAMTSHPEMVGGDGRDVTKFMMVATSGSGPSTSSTNEFHELHDEHCPDHFGWLAAQEVQR